MFGPKAETACRHPDPPARVSYLRCYALRNTKYVTRSVACCRFRVKIRNLTKPSRMSCPAHLGKLSFQSLDARSQEGELSVRHSTPLLDYKPLPHISHCVTSGLPIKLERRQFRRAESRFGIEIPNPSGTPDGFRIMFTLKRLGKVVNGPNRSRVKFLTR